jgi:hypothetical protein
LKGKAGTKVKLDDGDAFGLHQLLRGRHNIGLATMIEELGMA